MRQTGTARPRLRGRHARPEHGELAAPGTLGALELRAETETEGVIEHAGEYVYVGVVRGLHAFAPAGQEPVLFLHRSEVLSFRPER